MEDVSVIMPSLDPDEHLINLIDGLKEAGLLDIVVVDDGSATDKKRIFEEGEARGVTLLRHDKNYGKGRALKTALKWLMENRPETAGAVTADGDGQHVVEDIVLVARELAENSDSMVMGCRDFDAKSVPARSRIGNKATRDALRISTGRKVTDTQTGLRGLPVCRFKEFCAIEGERYEFEMRVLVYACRNEIPIREVSINTVYINGNGGSKFRVVADSLRIHRVFTFTLNSLLSTLLDLVIFSLLNWLLDMTGVPTSIKLLIATVVGRVCSSIVNYTINKKAVFRNGGRRSFVRYYIMWAFQMGASYGLVYLFVRLTGAAGLMKTVVKMCVDVTLFFVGCFIQKNWVFADDKKETKQLGGKK